MAFMGFEDFYGGGELMCFSDSYEKFGEMCKEEQMVLVRGKIEKETETVTDKSGNEVVRDKCKIAVAKMLPLEEARDSLAQALLIKVTTVGLEKLHVDELYHACEQHKGGCAVILIVQTASGNEFKMRAQGLSVAPHKETIDELRLLTGVDSVTLSQSKRGS